MPFLRDLESKNNFSNNTKELLFYNVLLKNIAPWALVFYFIQIIPL